MFKHPLAREVALVVAVKTAIVIGAALFVFGPRQRPAIDAASVETRLIGTPQMSPEPRSTLP